MNRVTLKDILKILWVRKVILIIVVIISICAAIGIYNNKKSVEYKYSATVYSKSLSSGSFNVDDKATEISTTVKELQVGSQLSKDYINFLDSEYVINLIKEELEKDYKKFKDYNSEDMSSYIGAKVSVQIKEEDSRFIQITSRENDKKLAEDILISVTKALKDSTKNVFEVGSVKIIGISFVSATNKSLTNAVAVASILIILAIIGIFILESVSTSLINKEAIEEMLNLKIIGEVSK